MFPKNEISLLIKFSPNYWGGNMRLLNSFYPNRVVDITQTLVCTRIRLLKCLLAVIQPLTIPIRAIARTLFWTLDSGNPSFALVGPLSFIVLLAWKIKKCCRLLLWDGPILSLASATNEASRCRERTGQVRNRIA